MRYLEMGVAFLAVGFIASTTVISMLTILLWRACRPRLRRSDSLFLLRMLPAIGSVSLVLGVVLPAFLLFEPRDTSERAGPAVAVLVVLAGALVGSGLYRALVSWRETRRLERAWTTVALRTERPGIPAPIYRVPSEMPFAALVGVVRPRLFVSDRFFDALGPAEQQAVVHHETGHLLARDNLKRFAMRLAPDWLPFSAAGREIEAAWSIAAEEAADDHAARSNGVGALELASALLKAARFRPMRCASVANFCNAATIAGRVARLLESPPARPGTNLFSAARMVGVFAILGLGAMLAGPARAAAFATIEAALRLLR